MKGITIYLPPGSTAQAAQFIEGLDPKLREKLLRQQRKCFCANTSAYITRAEE